MRARSYFYTCFIILLVSHFVCAGCPERPKEDIKIGTTVSLTGKYLRLSSEQLNGLKLWVEKTNNSGGILGRKVKLIFYDDNSQPEEAAKLVERLIVDDEVDILVSPYSSPMTIRASEVSEKLGVPMIIVGASATKIWGRGYKNIFGMYTPASRYMDLAIGFAVNNNIDQIALIYENSAYAKDLAEGVKEKLNSENIELIIENLYEKNEKNFTEVIKNIKSNNVEMLIGASYLDETIAIVEEAHKQKYFPKIMIFAVGPGLPDFGATLREKAEGIMGSSQWEMTLPIQGVKEFSGKYVEKYGYKPGYHAAGGYGAGEIIGTIIEKNGSTEKNKFSKTARKLKSETIFGKYSVDGNGMQVGKPSYTIQWFGNKREIVLPDDVASREVAVPLGKAIEKE